MSYSLHEPWLKWDKLCSYLKSIRNNVHYHIWAKFFKISFVLLRSNTYVHFNIIKSLKSNNE